MRIIATEVRGSLRSKRVQQGNGGAGKSSRSRRVPRRTQAALPTPLKARLVTLSRQRHVQWCADVSRAIPCRARRGCRTAVCWDTMPKFALRAWPFLPLGRSEPALRVVRQCLARARVFPGHLRDLSLSVCEAQVAPAGCPTVDVWENLWSAHHHTQPHDRLIKIPCFTEFVNRKSKPLQNFYTVNLVNALNS